MEEFPMTNEIAKKRPLLYQFRLSMRKSHVGRVQRKMRVFWARGPQEALDQAKELLGIRGHVTYQKFKKAGARCLFKIRERIETHERRVVVFPF